MLAVAEARERILAACQQCPSEHVALAETLGRVLTENLTAIRDLPPWDNSAMDGYAVRAAELPARLPVSGVIAAGGMLDGGLAPGTCMKIMTGAPLPAGADTVVMREDAVVAGDAIEFSQRPPIGENVRRRGEDVGQGSILLASGTVIGPGEIALLAAQSQTQVPVARRPRVAILSTGDELVPPEATPGAGQIVSSNNLALRAQILEAGGVPIDAGIVRDRRADIERALASLVDYDVLLTSGGVSVGDFDFVKDALTSAGIDIAFWKVAIKPGKPLVFGTRKSGQLFFGLPGNPVSSMVSFELFVRPALRTLQGHPDRHRPRLPAVVDADIAKEPGRAHYLRCSLRFEAGRLCATPHRKQGSGTISSMTGMDGLVELAAEQSGLRAGDTAPVVILRLPSSS